MNPNWLAFYLGGAIVSVLWCSLCNHSLRDRAELHLAPLHVVLLAAFWPLVAIFAFFLMVLL